LLQSNPTYRLITANPVFQLQPTTLVRCSWKTGLVVVVVSRYVLSGTPASQSLHNIFYLELQTITYHPISRIPQLELIHCFLFTRYQICNKKFYSTTNLKNHKRIHTNEKPFRCQDCGESFTQKVSLEHHCSKHTGSMPYRCELCENVGFTYKKALRKHWATKHFEIYLSQNKFLCDVCWEHFPAEEELATHIKSLHEKHKCQV
jgi:hypothetical protein